MGELRAGAGGCGTGGDYNDTHRAAAPLRPAADAVTVDTTGFTFDDAFALLLSTIRARLGQEG